MNMGASSPPEVPDPREQQRQRFENRDQQEQFPCQVVVEDVRDRVIADAENAGNEKANDSKAQCPDGWVPKLVYRQTVELVFDPVKELRQADRRSAAHYAQQLGSTAALVECQNQCQHLNIAPRPNSIKRTLVASVVAMTKGINERARNSNNNSSIASMTPAMGALNVAAMPAAAPHPSSTLRSVAVVENIWPTSEPNAPPVWMIGPSAPNGPPGTDGNGGGKRLEDGNFSLDAAP